MVYLLKMGGFSMAMLNNQMVFPYFSTCFPIVFHRVFPPAAGRPGGRRRLLVFGAEAAGRCGRGAEVPSGNLT